MACVLCEVRRERRHCPAVNGEICAICCGTGREVTITCPLECEFLREARLHERPVPFDPAAMPNADIEVTERLIEQNADLMNVLGAATLQSALEADACDADAREALDSLARTYRTLQSGVYYESRPAGAYAGAIYAAVEGAAREFRAQEQRQLGVTHTRDAAVLGLLVFLQRMAIDSDNGRPRGRAFLDRLRAYYQASSPEPRSSLILP
jgi:hypothetical protein